MEKRQAGDAFASQARISVAARSSKRSATKLRTTRHAIIAGPLIMPQRPSGWTGRVAGFDRTPMMALGRERPSSA
jgi:hypothetical protein